MIRVHKLKEICETIVERVGLDGYIMASSEEQSTKKLSDAPGLRLVAVYPAHYFDGSADTYTDKHEALFFIVTRQDEGASEEKEVQQYADTQDAIIRLKQYIFGEDQSTGYCQPFPHLEVESVTIDPEYNMFGGYIGWSIKFIC